MSFAMRGAGSGAAAGTRCRDHADLFARRCILPPSRRSTTIAHSGPEVSKAVISSRDKAKLDEMMQRWKSADVDGNGAIDREELRQLLESTEGGNAVLFTQHWLPDQELDRIMEKYDRDGNGTIEFDEFKDIVLDGLLLEGALGEYEAAFKAVDSSGNGTIGATELAEVLRSMGSSMSYEAMVDIMMQYDRDESGQIEFNEFLMMFRNKLLDLQAVKSYMGARPEGKAPTEAMLDAREGDVALIFSEQELDEMMALCQASGKVVVLFCALTWCRPCKGMQRPAQKLAAAYKDTTMWAKLFGNANEQTKTMFKKRFKVRSTPAFIIIKDGKVVYTQAGSNKEKLEAGIRTVLAGHAALPVGMLYPSIEGLTATAALTT